MIEEIIIKKHKRTIHRKRPFVLIGNEIDGRLVCPQIYDFKNYSDLKKRLPDIMVSILGEGEWAFELYQVEKNYKIRYRWEYFKYPDRGKKIFTHDYCNNTIQKVVFDKSEMTLVGMDDSKYIGRQPRYWVEIRTIRLNWK